MKKYIISGLAGLLFLGCSTPYREAPLATNFKNVNQKKIESLSHWKLIAQDLVKNLTPKIQKNSKIYITQKTDTPFDKNLYTFLKNYLVQNGYNVVINPNYSNITLTYSSNILPFQGKYTPKRRDLMGSLVLLGAGVAVVSSSSTAIATGGAITGLEAINIIDSLKSETGASVYELSVNVEILDNQKYVSSVNRIYYIVDNQICLYKKCQTNSFDTIFKIKG